MGLLRNGVTDVNTEDPSQIDAASDALQELTDRVNLRFYTNEYQHLADGSIWLHQAWSGDIAAIGYYLPKGTPVSAISYWWPEDGRGLMGNDTFAVLKGAPHPVLAHLFLDHMLDTRNGAAEHRIHRLPAAAHGMTPEKVLEERTGPGEPDTTILREPQFRQRLPAGPAQRRRDRALGNRLVGSEVDVTERTRALARARRPRASLAAPLRRRPRLRGARGRDGQDRHPAAAGPDLEPARLERRLRQGGLLQRRPRRHLLAGDPQHARSTSPRRSPSASRSATPSPTTSPATRAAPRGCCCS